LTKLRESILGVVTYMTSKLKWSCLEHVPELSQVKLIRQQWCRSPHANLGVVMSSVTQSHEGGGTMAILLQAPLDHTFTFHVESSHPKHKNKSIRERPQPSALTIRL